MQRPRGAGDRAGGDARKARRLGLELVGDQRDVGVGALAPPLARPEKGEVCAGRRASVSAARNSSQPE